MQMVTDLYPPQPYKYTEDIDNKLYNNAQVEKTTAKLQ